jgi:hypothetical protein
MAAKRCEYCGEEGHDVNHCKDLELDDYMEGDW